METVLIETKSKISVMSKVLVGAVFGGLFLYGGFLLASSFNQSEGYFLKVNSSKNIARASSYENEQDIDFTAFPQLDMSRFSGQKIYVATDGSDDNDGSLNSPLLNITTAISRVPSGGQILIKEGIYNSTHLSLDKSLYLGNYNNGTVVLNISEVGWGRGIEVREEVVIEGIDFNISNTAGIYTYTDKDFIFKDSEVTMTGEGYREGVIAFDPSNGFLVENVRINNAIMGLSCNSGPCMNWKIKNVVIDNFLVQGGSGADCFAIENGENIFLENVESTNCSADGIDIKGSRVLLVNPFVHNLARNGIKLWQGGDVINALVYDTGADVSLVVSSSGNLRVINSVIAFHNYDRLNEGSGGSYLTAVGYDHPDGNYNVEFINTVFYRNEGWNSNPLLSTGDVINLVGDSNPDPNVTELVPMANLNLSYQNCVFYNVAMRDDVKAVIESGPNNMVDVDPKFINPSIDNGDFQLQADSPLLNAGQDTIYNFDRLSVCRPQGTNFDIGAYERVVEGSSCQDDQDDNENTNENINENQNISENINIAPNSDDGLEQTKIYFVVKNKDGKIIVRNLSAKQIVKSFYAFKKNVKISLIIGDADFDGQDDIIISDGNIIKIFNYNGDLIKKFKAKNSRVLNISDINSDGKNELLVANNNKIKIYKYKKNKFKKIKVYKVKDEIKALAGGKKLFAATKLNLFLYNAKNKLKRIWVKDFKNISFIKIVDLDSDKKNEVLIRVKNKLYCYNFVDLNLKRRFIIKKKGSVSILDVDNDGKLEILIFGGGKNFGVYSGSGKYLRNLTNELKLNWLD